MKQALLKTLGIVALAGVISFCFLQSPKETPVEENLLGVDYSIEGHIVDLSYETENPVVAMHIKKYGTIVIELYPEIAPNTVNNFISLVTSGFYDNNTFHRLDPRFVLQGGDPTGTGRGGPKYYIAGEFIENGFSNKLSHEKWVVSMAREPESYDSAGSQFFICLEDATYLDGNYASFGRVIDGFSNIEKIISKAKIADEETGKLLNDLTLEKTVIDLQGKEYPEPDKLQEE